MMFIDIVCFLLGFPIPVFAHAVYLALYSVSIFYAVCTIP